MEPDYQKFIKQQIKDYHLLIGKGQLITHMEVAALFLVRAADLYLKEGGAIAFVMPRSVFTADQHDELRCGVLRFTQNKLFHLVSTVLWDCDRESPLFNVAACVVWGEKIKAIQGPETISGKIISGILPRKNVSLSEAEQKLTFQQKSFAMFRYGKRSYWDQGTAGFTKAASYYKKWFSQGATIVPRSFWFVQIESSSYGFNPDGPPLLTDPRAIKEAKKPFQGIRFSGKVESRFLYATLLSTDLPPFGHLDFRLVVVPILAHKRRYQLLNAETARKNGFSYLANWLEIIEVEWEARRGTKAEKMNIYERIDRYSGLTKQNPQSIYYVIYNALGSILTAALVKDKNPNICVNGSKIDVQNFIADYKLYFYETSSIEEGFYLISLLNSRTLDNLIKPMQARGLWGPRGIETKVLELQIPQFEKDDTNTNA